MKKSQFKKWTIAALALCTSIGIHSAGATEELLSQTSMESQIVRRNFESLASCVFERIYTREQSGLKKTDLISNGIIRISLDTGSVTYWTLTFTRVSPTQTKVDLTTVRTMWGPVRTGSVTKLLPDVRACEN